MLVYQYGYRLRLPFELALDDGLAALDDPNSPIDPEDFAAENGGLVIYIIAIPLPEGFPFFPHNNPIIPIKSPLNPHNNH